uniref:Uncharacterized protein n=1 Tax=Cacopsylla melanoneura TaxID=428564 RepID=A0A8D8WVY9_9HEMI
MLHKLCLEGFTIYFLVITSQKSRLDEVCLMRLRVGHCNFSHVYLFKREDKPMCCNEPLTIEHILVKCSKLRYRSVSNFPLTSVPEILKNDPDSVAAVLIRFSRETISCDSCNPYT